jgi:hypothetical protein
MPAGGIAAALAEGEAAMGRTRRAVVRALWIVAATGWPAVALLRAYAHPAWGAALADGGAGSQAVCVLALLRDALAARSRAVRREAEAARRVDELAGRVDAMAAAMEAAFMYAAPDRRHLRAVPGPRGEGRRGSA